MEKIPAHIPMTDRNFLTRVWHRFLDALQRMAQRTEDLEYLDAAGAFTNSVQDLRGILRDIKTEIALIERTPDSERENLALKLLAYSVDSYSGRVRDLERSFDNLCRRVEAHTAAGDLRDLRNSLADLRSEVSANRPRYDWRYDFPVWDDLNFDAAGLAKGAAAPDVTEWEGRSDGPLVAVFDGNATAEQVNGWEELPHSYKNGTDLSAHVHIAPTTAAAGDVKLTLNYSIVTDSGSTNGTLTATVTMTGTAWEEAFIAMGTISGAGVEFGSQMGFQLVRDPSDAADTYGDDVAVLTFGMHFMKDAGGSRTMLTK